MDIINGKAIADEIKAELQSHNRSAGISPCLAVIDVGDNKENAQVAEDKEKYRPSFKHSPLRPFCC